MPRQAPICRSRRAFPAAVAAGVRGRAESSEPPEARGPSRPNGHPSAVVVAGRRACSPQPFTCGVHAICAFPAFPELSSSSRRRSRALQAVRAWACECQNPGLEGPGNGIGVDPRQLPALKPLKCTLSVQRPDHAAPGPTGRPDHAAPRPRRGPQLWTRGARTERRPDDGPSAGPIAWTLRRYTGSLISWPGWIGRGRPGFAARSASVVSR